MNKLNNESKQVNRTGAGSIDYKHYNETARNLRSEFVLNLFYNVFTSKKNSLIDHPNKNQIIEPSNNDKVEVQLNKAA